MNKASIASNSIFLSITNFTEKIFGFVVTIIVARALGEYDYGIFTSAFAFSSLFGSVFNLGFPLIIPRLLNQKPEKQNSIITGALALFCFVYPLILILIGIYLKCFTWGIKDIPIIISFLAVLNQAMFSLSYFFKSIYLAKEKLSYDVYFTFIGKVFLLVLLSLLFIVKPSNVFVYSAYIISNVVHLILLAKFLKIIEINYKVVFEKSILIEIWKNIVPLVFSSILYHIYISIDALIVLNKLGAASAGSFGAAKRLYQTIIFVSYALNLSFYPQLCKGVKNSIDDVISVLKLNFKVMVTLILPICIGTFFYAKEIIYLSLGAKYSNAVILLQYFAPIILVTSISYIFTYLIYAQEKLKFYSRLFVLTTPINIILNLLLINILGVEGSVLALLVSEIIFVLICFYGTKEIVRNIFNKELLYIIGINLFILAIIMLINLQIANISRLFIALIITAPLYFFLISKFKIFDVLNILRNVLQKKAHH